MDLGTGSRPSGKRSQPALERGDDPKRAKRASTGAKASSAAAPFDLARIIPGALEAAKLRQQDAISRSHKTLEGMLSVFKVADDVMQSEGVPVEVEARIGYLRESTFISGVSEQIFNLLQRILSQERCLLIQPDTVETDYIYERPEDGHYRVTTIGEGSSQRVINAGMKTRRTDMILNELQTDLHYVVRLSVSSEEEDEEKPDKVANNWMTSRKKTRSTFTNCASVPLPATNPGTPNSAIIPWRIDLTRVETTRAMRIDSVQLDPPTITFEVELEMPPLSDDSHVGLKTKVVACNDGVSLLMCALSYASRNSEGPIRWSPPSHASAPQPAPSHPPQSIPSSTHKEVAKKLPLDPKRHPDFPSLPFERVASTQSLRSAFERCFKDHPQFENSNRFLGTMPINFARRHLHIVRNKPYWVSEKTDGVRFMLFVSRSGASPTPSSPMLSSSSSSIGHLPPSLFLIDRSNNFFRVPHLQGFASALSPMSDTLLDGELVKKHQDDESYYFLIFDAITVDGRAVWNLPMEHRLSHIAAITGLFRSYSQSNSAETFPFSLSAKEIVPKERFNIIRQNIHLDPNGESVYRSTVHCHLTDGLIFMPECPYPLYTCQSMFKWKFVDRQTIDFEVTFPAPSGLNEQPYATGKHQNTAVELHIGGNAGSTVLTRTVSLLPDDLEKLKQDIFHSLRPNLVIAEMGFDSHTGLWRYHKLRPDKDKPNYIFIAMDTMESIAENISLEEMETVFHSAPANGS